MGLGRKNQLIPRGLLEVGKHRGVDGHVGERGQKRVCPRLQTTGFVDDLLGQGLHARGRAARGDGLGHRARGERVLVGVTLFVRRALVESGRHAPGQTGEDTQRSEGEESQRSVHVFTYGIVCANRGGQAFLGESRSSAGLRVDRRVPGWLLHDPGRGPAGPGARRATLPQPHPRRDTRPLLARVAGALRPRQRLIQSRAARPRTSPSPPWPTSSRRAVGAEGQGAPAFTVSRQAWPRTGGEREKGLVSRTDTPPRTQSFSLPPSSSSKA
jgi:hypothetical protein